MGKILEKATQTAELLGGIRDEIAEVDEQMVELQSQSTAHSNSIGELQSQQNSISGRVSTLSGNVSALSGRIDALEITPPTSVSYVSSVTEGVSKQGTCFVIRKNKLIAIIQDGKIIYAPYGIVYAYTPFSDASIKINGKVYSVTKRGCYIELGISDVFDLSDAFYVGGTNKSNFGEIGVYIDTSNVTTMRSMFKNKANTTYRTKQLEISCFDTSSVTDMGEMFSGCSGLTSLDVSNFDTSSVTSMGSMFSGCSGLTSLDVSNFDTSSVTNMRNMFSGCKMTTLDLSSFDTSSVTDMRDMFSGCEIDNIILGVFDVTKQAEELSKNNWIFKLCSLSQIGELRINNYVNLSNNKFPLILNNQLNSERRISKVIIANISQTTTLWGLFFSGLYLESVDLSQINTSNVTDMREMFWGCELLTTLDLSNFDTSSVTNMAYMFYGCSGLTTLDLSGFDTSSVTNMSNMFNGCSGLTTLKFPNMGMLKADGTGNSSIDFASCPLGTAGEESRQALIDMFSYDRTANGLTNTLTVRLSAASKALLTPEEIAAITAKDYTIA